ncbi:MAG: hypothetical protein PHG79_11450 [Methanosarcina sp.]|nr:hypothetical protein [Methanosarcina sp.]
MVFTTSLPINKIHMFGVRFVENGIIYDKKSSFRSDQYCDSKVVPKI